jgi:hypothetical protein
MNIKIYHDLKSLEQKMQPLVGQLCWQARLGYGDELCLEFGERIPYNSPLLEDEFKGEWQLGSRGSDWGLFCNGETLATSELEIEQLSPLLKRIEGTKVTQIRIFYPILLLNFDNQFCLLIKLNPDDLESQDLAAWELFTPNHRILEFYPNGTWSEQASDEIIQECSISIV